MNITLISANSYHLINEEIKKIVNNNEYLTINFNKSSIAEILEEASYVTLTDNKKYVVVTNANFFATDKLNDDDTERLLSYFKKNNPNTILIFTTLLSIDSRKKIVKELKNNYKIINITPWDKKKMREEVNRYIKNNNYFIDYDTVTFLIDNTYNNIDILFNEIDKIFLFYNKLTRIKLEDVIKIVGKEIDSNSFHFVSAVIEKDLDKSIEIYKSLKVYKVEAISLIILLAREYKLMYYVKKLSKDRFNISFIASELNMQDWQVNKLYNNSLKYSESDLLKNIALLSDIDLNIKNGSFDKDVAIYPFLMEVCI